MRRSGLDALIATSPINVTYVSGYDCWLDPLNKEYMGNPGASGERSFQNYAVLPANGDPALVLPAMFAVNAADLSVRDLVPYGKPPLDFGVPLTKRSDSSQRWLDLFAQPTNNTSTDALVRVLEQRGLSNGRIGLEMESLSTRTRSELAQRLPHATLLDCTNLIRLVRAVKSAEEIAILARATEIAEDAARAALALAEPERRISDLARQFALSVAEQGAVIDHFAYGMNGLGIALKSDFALAEGDVLYVDYGCVYQNYISDAGVTLAVGKLSPEMSSRYVVLREVLAVGAERVRAGVAASTVQYAMQTRMERLGHVVGFPHGHGIGMELRDYPIVVPNNGLHIRDDCVDVPSDLPLETDMVINLEASFFMPGAGSLNIEQSFVVTDTGWRPLANQDRSAPL